VPSLILAETRKTITDENQTKEKPVAVPTVMQACSYKKHLYIVLSIDGNENGLCENLEFVP
jgi:hypothetical protein